MFAPKLFALGLKHALGLTLPVFFFALCVRLLFIVTDKYVLQTTGTLHIFHGSVQLTHVAHLTNLFSKVQRLLIINWWSYRSGIGERFRAFIINAFTHSFYSHIHPSLQSFIQLVLVLIHTLNHSFAPSVMHSFIRSFINSFMRVFVYSISQTIIHLTWGCAFIPTAIHSAMS